ncbi:McrB family protein [Streptococcus suis]|uniref:McrB family protein n=1 Tax=Streptococcus suis TaxID=1307 RepID=UPI000CF5D513|nr:AAA family ATPase [Streptococcus suis]
MDNEIVLRNEKRARTFYFVGSKLGEKDYLEEFKQKGKWELGWRGNEDSEQYQKMYKILKTMQPGDILFAKTSYTRKKKLPFEIKDEMTVSVMNIRGMGKVKEVLDDGHTVIVEWEKSYVEREWYFFTGQETIWVPSTIKNREEETRQLVDFAISQERKEQDYHYFFNHPSWSKYKGETMKKDNIFEYKHILEISHNLILRGAPGTGKTYLAKQIAEELTGGNPEQIGFVQFHPSYDYTDFVEGLRPVKDDSGEIKFDIKPGIFKEFCQKAIKSSKSGGQDNFDETWETFWEAVSDEPDGYKMKTLTGKPMNLEAYERGGMPGVTEKKSGSRFYNRNQCYNVYRGLPGTPKGGFDTYRKAIIQEMQDKFGLKPYQAPEDIQSDKKFVFIIDEINRGEISKIFGELFYAIDPGYRGKKGEISTQYANMYEGEEKFYIPENVYIIGTMNDIDRSVDSFDFAMRRRFRFVEITAAESLGMWVNQLDASEIGEASRRLTNLNNAIENVADLNRNYHIGPSYFLVLPQLDYDYDLFWKDYIQPLLEEYLRGSYQEAEVLEGLKAAFDKLEDTGYVDNG